MRKASLFFVAIILFKCSSGQIKLGIKTGMNIATTKNLIAFPKNRVGWYAGGFAKIPIQNRFFLQPELLYSTKGDGVNQIPDTKTVLRFNYFNAPILLGYKIDHKTFFLVGPELGYLATARMVINGTENLNVTKNYPNKLDVGLDVGINYEIIKEIGLEVRYNYGFKTLYYVDGAGVRYSQNKGGNRVFQFGVNYTL